MSDENKKILKEEIRNFLKLLAQSDTRQHIGRWKTLSFIYIPQYVPAALRRLLKV